MERIVRVLSLILGIGVAVALAAGPAPASPPPPSYGPATLTVDSSCNFTAAVTWSHTKVDSVLFTLHIQGSISEHQDTVTPRGRKAIDTIALGTATTHTFYVTADLSLNGAVVDTETSSTVDAGCAFLL